MINNLTFLGHAGFIFETKKSIILMDPWLSKSGAYFNGWFQYPNNHFLESEVLEKLKNDRRKKYIYISHYDKDHIDKDFLAKTSSLDVDYFIPKFTKTEGMLRTLTSYCKINRNNITSFQDSQIISLDDELQIAFYIQDSTRESDSAILIKNNSFVFLNANDCKLHDRMSSIKKIHGKIDLLAMQFSGAAWYPVVYKEMLGDNQYSDISRRKTFSRFKTLLNVIKTCEIKNYIPSAGPPCFLHPNSFHVNFEKNNIFPDSKKIKKYLKVRNKELNIFDLNPGELLDINTMIVEKRDDYKIQGLDPYVEKINYLNAYQALVKDSFKKAVLSDNDKLGLIKKLVSEFDKKLSKYNLSSKVDRNLYIKIFESKDNFKILEVNFKLRKVRIVENISAAYYLINLSYEDLRVYFLDEYSNFHDLLLSCRQTMDRCPENYDYLIDAFLVLEINEFDSFERHFNSINQQVKTERINITYKDQTYEIDRWCPHEKADLKCAEINSDGNLICPRHCWEFNLENNGQCEKIKKYTINSKKIT